MAANPSILDQQAIHTAQKLAANFENQSRQELANNTVGIFDTLSIADTAERSSSTKLTEQLTAIEATFNTERIANGITRDVTDGKDNLAIINSHVHSHNREGDGLRQLQALDLALANNRTGLFAGREYKHTQTLTTASTSLFTKKAPEEAKVSKTVDAPIDPKTKVVPITFNKQ